MKSSVVQDCLEMVKITLILANLDDNMQHKENIKFIA